MSKIGNIFDEYCHFFEKHTEKYGQQTIVLMQVGMFHELYGIDNDVEKIGYVKEISEVLNIQMTRRDKKILENNRKNFLMAGFPSIQIDRYVNILLENNYTVVIVDQLTEPPNVQRGVTRIYSPGTYIEECKNSDNNYLITIYLQGEQKLNHISRCKKPKNLVETNDSSEDTSQEDQSDHRIKKSTLLTVGLSAVDLSTGESHIYEAWSNIEDTNYALDETYRFIQAHSPKEIVIYGKDWEDIIDKETLFSFLDLQEYVCHIRTDIPKDYYKVEYQNHFLRKVFKNEFGILTPIEWLDLENRSLSVLSFLLNLQFAWEHNDKIVDNLKKPEIWDQQNHLILANNAINQLALINSGSVGGNGTGLGANSKFRSVFHIIDKTCTPMGKRLLKYRLLNPILDSTKINQRYDLIQEMLVKIPILETTRTNNGEKEEYKFRMAEKYLNNIVDIQRFHRKLSLGILQPSEFNTLDNSYKEINKLFEFLIEDSANKEENITSKDGLLLNSLLKPHMARFKLFQEYYEQILDLEESGKYNLNNLTDSFFKLGYNQELDEISYQIRHYEQFFHLLGRNLSRLVSQGTDCVTLKFSETTGHYFNLTQNRYKSLLNNWKKEQGQQKLEIKVDDKSYWIHVIEEFRMEPVSKKSSSCNLFSEKIKEISDNLVTLQKEIRNKTTKVYLKFLDKMHKEWGQLMDEISNIIAKIDVAKSGAKTSILYHYNRPKIAESKGRANKNIKSFIKTSGLRHPIIERINQKIIYVPHDLILGTPTEGDVSPEDKGEMDGLLVYGVNSCGKSSLMKSVGINLVLAQAGMYVAADSFEYLPYHYILTRIVGNDNLFKGLSSFAVEMSELRGILKRANSQSLVLGDEICHGTETISAVAIVASAIRHLARKESSFIFATHLHQLAGMKDIKELKNVKNFHLRVFFDQKLGELVYDRHLVPGSGDPIYGLEVAKAMQMDNEFLKEANRIRRDILDIGFEVMPTRKSHFNAGVYLDKCQVCMNKAQDTHHIGFQCTADGDNFIGHYHKNIMSNLVPLCKECHQKVHLGDKENNTKLVIDGYKETSQGIKLNFFYEKLDEKNAIDI